MVLAPAVIDAAIPAGAILGQMVRNLRLRPEMAARGRERSHLLLLYAPLCSLITCKEVRVREMVKDVLTLAGAELGLGLPQQRQPSQPLPTRRLTSAALEDSSPLASPSLAESAALRRASTVA